MNILIDIGHPAHVHLYRNFYHEMTRQGHKVMVVVKDIQSAKDLMDIYSIPYVNLGGKKDSNFLKGIYQLKYNWLVYKLVKKNKIDIGVGSSLTLTHVSRFTKMKSVITNDDDDEVDPLFSKFAHPFADSILTPDVLLDKRVRDNCSYYPGYHELAYLHPNHFQPDKSILKEVGLKDGDKFFILRFNAFKASHDVGVKGLSLENKLQLVKTLEKYGKIFITTEREIEPELSKYQMKISPEKAHSLLSYATMFLGDSQTMTSEAAVLGVPSFRCNSFVGRISYLEEEEHKYDLTYAFLPENFDMLLNKVKELLEIGNLSEVWQEKRNNLLSDKIDVTKFVVWYVSNYPMSQIDMRKKDFSFEKFK